jgi:hypothetical protein
MNISIGDKNKIKRSTIGNNNAKQNDKSVTKEIIIAIVATVIGGIILAIYLNLLNLQS